VTSEEFKERCFLKVSSLPRFYAALFNITRAYWECRSPPRQIRSKSRIHMRHPGIQNPDPDPRDFQNLVRTSRKNSTNIRSLCPVMWAIIWKNAASCSVEESFGNFLDPGPDADDSVASFQPNIGGSDISYTSYSTTSPSSLL